MLLLHRRSPRHAGATRGGDSLDPTRMPYQLMVEIYNLMVVFYRLMVKPAMSIKRIFRLNFLTLAAENIPLLEVHPRRPDQPWDSPPPPQPVRCLFFPFVSFRSLDARTRPGPGTAPKERLTGGGVGAVVLRRSVAVHGPGGIMCSGIFLLPLALRWGWFQRDRRMCRGTFAGFIVSQVGATTASHVLTIASCCYRPTVRRASFFRRKAYRP